MTRTKSSREDEDDSSHCEVLMLKFHMLLAEPSFGNWVHANIIESP